MSKPWPARLGAWVAAVIVAAGWASVVQTQLNLAGLQALGAEVPFALRMRTTGQDLLGFAPLFAAVAAVAFALAFPLAARLARARPRRRPAWYALAGLLALVVAIRLVDAVTPPPVLIAATRGLPGLLLVCVGGGFAGAVYAWLRRRG
jgi:drug/metabolite transporter (DMT)-like permease